MSNTDGTLTLRARKRKRKTTISRSGHYGAFQVPNDVDAERIETIFAKGI
jgi:hypothetical protein